MSTFGNLSSDGLAESEDRLGGFQAIPTDAYIGTIKALFAGKAAASNAQNFTIIVDINGQEYRETIYVTNRNGQNWFHPKDKSGKENTSMKNPLPGFTHINDICLIVAGKPLSEMTAEDKIMNVYDPEAKKELPKSVPMVIEVLGQKIGLAILREISFKQEKDSNTGEYVDTQETRTQNTIDKVFHPELNITVAEAKAGATAPDFIPKWTEKNKGVDRDKTKGKTGGNEAPKSGRPGGASQTNAAPTSSLFGKK